MGEVPALNTFRKHDMSYRLVSRLSYILPYFAAAPGVVTLVLSAISGALAVTAISPLLQPYRNIQLAPSHQNLRAVQSNLFQQVISSENICLTPPRFDTLLRESDESSYLLAFLDYNTFFEETVPTATSIRLASYRTPILHPELEKEEEDLAPDFSDDVPQDCPQMRMRPGYATQWRLWRAAYAARSPLRFFRQKRWTTHFQRARVASGLPLLWAASLSAVSCLCKAYPLYSAAVISQLLVRHRVYIRGTRTYNLLTQVYVGDTLWVQNMLTCDVCGTEGFQYIPNYLEIDYYSGAITLLCLPPVFTEEVGFLFCETPLFAMRLYNWKYVA